MRWNTGSAEGCTVNRSDAFLWRAADGGIVQDTAQRVDGRLLFLNLHARMCPRASVDRTVREFVITLPCLKWTNQQWSLSVPSKTSHSALWQWIHTCPHRLPALSEHVLDAIWLAKPPELNRWVVLLGCTIKIDLTAITKHSAALKVVSLPLWLLSTGPSISELTMSRHKLLASVPIFMDNVY